MDNDTYAIDAVRLGVMEVDNGTSGSVYFDDFEARRMSYIDVLPDPGIPDPEPTAQPSWLESDYIYTGSAPHAVTSVEREQTDQSTITDTYVYDSNGNMICRDEAGQVWKHDYNAENRISAVYKMNGTDCTTQGSVTETWTFTYDGNGVRVKEEYKIGETDQYTKYYFTGGGYEVEVNHVDNPDTTTTKKYYSFAGMMVAMEKVVGENKTLYYFASDHLSSSSVVMNSSGGLESENRYMPFGEVRDITGYDDPITETDFGYTGQRNISGIGLMDYNARFYNPSLGRFIQPDSFVQNPENPQSLNRFSYVLNNPTRYIDPTGHKTCEDFFWECENGEWISGNVEFDPNSPLVIFENSGQDWKDSEKEAITAGSQDTATALANEINEGRSNTISWLEAQGLGFEADGITFVSPTEAWYLVMGGPVTHIRSGQTKDYGAKVTGDNEITYYNVQIYRRENGRWVRDHVSYDYVVDHMKLSIHEFGHIFDKRTKRAASIDMTGDLTVTEDDINRGFAGGFEVGRYSDETSSREVWADMFLGWVRGNVFANDKYGDARTAHNANNMYGYILQVLSP